MHNFFGYKISTEFAFYYKTSPFNISRFMTKWMFRHKNINISIANFPFILRIKKATFRLLQEARLSVSTLRLPFKLQKKFVLPVTTIIIIFSLSVVNAFSAVNRIAEEDGSPSKYPWEVRFPNSSLSDNNDGTVSIDFVSTGSSTVTSSFDDILSATDDTVQKALDTLDDGAVNITGDTMTGALEVPTLAITTTTAFEGISYVVSDFVIQSNVASGGGYAYFNADENQSQWLYVVADGEGGTWKPYMFLYSGEKTTPINPRILSTGALDIMTGPVTAIGEGDTTDYVRIFTTGDVPEITTVGSCDLKINASSNAITSGSSFTTTSTITGDILTDGTATMTGGTVGATTITDGIASMTSGQFIDGAGGLLTGDQLTASTITDNTLTINSGAITSAVSLDDGTYTLTMGTDPWTLNAGLNMGSDTLSAAIGNFGGTPTAGFGHQVAAYSSGGTATLLVENDDGTDQARVVFRSGGDDWEALCDSDGSFGIEVENALAVDISKTQQLHTWVSAKTTNAVDSILRIDQRYVATTANAEDGVKFDINILNSNGNLRGVADLAYVWKDDTQASEVGAIDFYVAEPNDANSTTLDLALRLSGDDIADFQDFDITTTGTLGAGQATITKMNLGGGLTAFVLNGVSLDAIVGATSQLATELQYVALQHSNTPLAGSRFMLSRSRGTLASPLIVVENDALAAFDAAAYDGTDYVLAGEIDFEVDGEPGGNDMPGRIVFKTTADGGILPAAKWTIKNTGHLLSGTDGTGVYNITTAGTSTTKYINIGDNSPGATGSLYFHLNSTSTEPFRLEKNNSAGILFSIKNSTNTWAIGQNSSEDFIFRDVTDSSADVMRIAAGTGAYRLMMDSSGLVGINHASIGDMDSNLDVNGTFRAGDASNYMVTAADGIINLVGTARVIKHYNIPLESTFGASAPTVDVSDAPFLSWEFDVNDDTHHTFMAPHDMDYTQAANVYVVWYTDTSQTDDEVNWQIQWNAKANGEAVNAGSTTDTSGDVNCPTQWQVQHTLIETIAANSIAADDVIGIDLTRVAIVDGTNPVANTIFVLAFHFEYTANKLGEAT
jgi:hypothetical protein